ncbi:hypothetical protein AYI70_g3959 [Smittium culicis]|uniref:Uncharacterized protein n=1 Tax=Smittium culicis TaxID=133412 RepID=A0A1R1Y155_9FUNG|nr:hypothetical protein AYI70_g3959 [Smittium culicis]
MYSRPNGYPPPLATQEEDCQGVFKDDNTRVFHAAIRERNRGNHRGTAPSSRSEEFERLRAASELQDGVPLFDMQNDIEEGLFDVDRSPGRVPSHSYPQEMQEISEFSMEWEIISVPSPLIRHLIEPPYLYQDTSPGEDFGTINRDEYCCLFGRYNNYRQEYEGLPSEHQYGSQQASGPMISRQGIKVIPYTQAGHKPLGYGNQYKDYVPQGSKEQDSRPHTRGISKDKEGCNHPHSSFLLHRQGSSNISRSLPWTIDVEEIVGA